ncbi:unnamed protein product [Parajaminaea phylloscopi]
MATGETSAQPPRPLRILLVNDDGPPAGNSPHILGLYKTLVARGHDVSVVIPCSQRSWGAMAFSISGEAGVWWYYPREGDHLDPDVASRWEAEPRPLREGEIAEWVLVDGSPTTCANVGLFNQSLVRPNAPAKPFDLCLSGPNFGRNTGAAFCLSSGTLGAAQAASLSHVKAIALSYGHFAVVPKAIQQTIDERSAAGPTSSGGTSADAAAAQASSPTDTAQTKALRDEQREGDGSNRRAPSPPPKPAPSSSSKRPTGWKNVAPVAPAELVELAHGLSVDIVERLWEEWDPAVGVYNVNVPLAWTLRAPEVYVTTTWRNAYPQLFQPVPVTEPSEADAEARPKTGASPNQPAKARSPRTRIVFQPEISSMMTRGSDKDLAGTDTWALMNGHISITPLKPGFIEPLAATNDGSGEAEVKRWRL